VVLASNCLNSHVSEVSTSGLQSTVPLPPVVKKLIGTTAIETAVVFFSGAQKHRCKTAKQIERDRLAGKSNAHLPSIVTALSPIECRQSQQLDVCFISSIVFTNQYIPNPHTFKHHRWSIDIWVEVGCVCRPSRSEHG